jgi:hypothetical protein
MWRLRRPFLPSTFLYVEKEQKENKPKSWTRTRSSVHTRPATWRRRPSGTGDIRHMSVQTCAAPRARVITSAAYY